MPFFEHDGLKFNYKEVGEGIPFIFQHGLGGSIDQPLSLFTPPPGMRLITFDFRGHGETQLGPREKLNFITFSNDVLAFMKHLKLEQAIIGGISMGAAVSLNFALRYPNHTLGLVLSRPAWLDGPMELNNSEIFKLVSTFIMDYGREIGREKFIESECYIRLLKESPSVAESLLGYFNYKHVLKTAAKFECLPADAPSCDRKDWKKIQAPTLILANKLDPIHPFEYGIQYADEISQAEFKEITPKSTSKEEHARGVQEYIEEFVKRNFYKNYFTK